MKANHSYGNIYDCILLRIGGAPVLELQRMRVIGKSGNGKQIMLPEDSGRGKVTQNMLPHTHAG
jgi:hypothetical protein